MSQEGASGCRRNWEAFWAEKLQAPWTKLFSAGASQHISYLLPGRKLTGCDSAVREAQAHEPFPWGERVTGCGQCGQGACRLPASHSCILVTGGVILKPKCASSRPGSLTGRGEIGVAKQHLPSPQRVASAAQGSFFAIHRRESVDPSSSSCKRLHLYNDKEKCLILHDESNSCFSQEMN